MGRGLEREARGRGDGLREQVRLGVSNKSILADIGVVHVNRNEEGLMRMCLSPPSSERAVSSRLLHNSGGSTDLTLNLLASPTCSLDGAEVIVAVAPRFPNEVHQPILAESFR